MGAGVAYCLFNDSLVMWYSMLLFRTYVGRAAWKGIMALVMLFIRMDDKWEKERRAC